MHLQRILCICFSILGMIGTFLPWIVIKSNFINISANGTEGDGWITFLLFLVALILALIPDIRTPLKSSLFWACIIAPVIAGIIVIFDVYNAQSNLNNPIGELLSTSISFGSGIYVIIGASISTPVALFLTKNR